MMVIGGLLPLGVLLALGYGLYRLLARHGGDTGVGRPGDVREQVIRFFRLALLAIALVLSAEGVAGILGEALPRTGRLAEDRSAALAQALAFTIVGGPALYGLARWTRHRLRVDPDDVASTAWALYLGVTATVALIVTVVSTQRALQWVLGLAGFDGRAVGRAVTWGAVFAVHLILNRRRPLLDRHGGVEDRTPWYLMAGSLVGLITLAIGGWRLLRDSLRPLYDLAFLDVLARNGSDAVVNAVVTTGLGAAVWGWYWVAHTRSAPRTERWYGYVLLVGVLGGLVAAVSAAGVLLHTALQWFFGDPTASTAGTHFQTVPGTVATLVLGLAVWGHHRHTLAAAPVHRGEVDRIYTYLAAFVGLVVSAAAVTLVVSGFVEVLVGSGDVGGSLANPVVLAATFLLLGLPVWGFYWRRGERNAAADRSELRSPSRRLYLLALIGLSAAVGLVSLVVLLTIFLEDLTAGDLAAATVLRLRVALGLVVAAGTVATYHLLVYRDDRRTNPAPPPPIRPPREVVLISDLDPSAAGRVAEALGGRVVRFTTAATGPPPDDGTLARAVAETGDLPPGRVLVTVRQGAIEVQGLRD